MSLGQTKAPVGKYTVRPMDCMGGDLNNPEHPKSSCHTWMRCLLVRLFGCL